MAINLQRRKTVMGRSIRLGHCVCTPQQPCPCDTFKKYNVCPCAGEKMPVLTGDVALTRHVRRAGCASKIGQADLLRIIKGLPAVTDPNVLVGAAAGDDAGVYQIDAHTTLVQTVDVFTPCVDDPWLFGQIAAANSLSDVYAMGGRPLTALSIIGFPIEELDGAVMQAILAGGMAKLAEAGCALLGGHSINDEEVKCGFAVTGLIDPARVIQRDRARVGDALVLTKPLGTGVISFAAQLGRVSPAGLEEVGRFMATLNKDAAELMLEHDAHACTDVTGFGLAGHLLEMARGSAVSVELDLAALPVLAAAAECLSHEIFSGAVERNEEYSMGWVRVADGVSDERDLSILYDPQTSGGLLVALDEKAAVTYVAQLRARGHVGAAIIGRIVENEPTRAESEILINPGKLMNLVGEREGILMNKQDATQPTPDAEKNVSPDAEPLECCSGEHVGPDAGAPAVAPATQAGARDVGALFKNFMKEASREGALDPRTKKILAIALSVAQYCRPCLKVHIQTALAMGIGKAEIDEAAWLAIGFAGAPSMMLYQEVCQELGV